MAATRAMTGRQAAGRFATREELTCHVWSIYRQQVFPNIRAVAAACGVTMMVVKNIVETEEGLGDYLKNGCPTGAS